MKIQLAQLSFLLHGVVAQWQAKVPLESRSLDAIYDAAKKEASSNPQPLQISWGGDAGTQGDGVRKAWKQRFPDIPLNLTVDLSKFLNGRIDTAFYSGEHSVDVAFLQTLQDFPRWKAQNRLLYYKPAEFNDIFNGEKDHDGAWLGLFNYGFGKIAYDSSKLNTSDIPTTFESFRDPFWKSKLVLTYPNDDDAVAYLFSLIVSKYGHSWLQDLAANDVQWVKGTASAQFEIARQHNSTNSSRALTFTSGTGSDSWWKSSTPDDQYVSWAQTGAIFASTPKPEAAKLFVSWIASKEFQRTMSSTQYALNTDARNLLLSNSTQLSGFRQFEQDRATVEWWKNQYEDLLGTPQGPSPLAVYPNPPFEG